MCESDQRIAAYLERVGYDAPISREEFKKALEGAIQARALMFYFTYKTLQRLHPEIDADEVMIEASRAYGAFNAQAMGDVKTAEDAMLNQSSKMGLIAFEQELTHLSDDYAEKAIYNCPLINAFKRVGCSQEEITKLCTKLLMPLDFALLAPFPDIELEFPKNLAEHDVCLMCVRKKETK